MAEAILAAKPGAADTGRTLGSEDIPGKEGAVDTSLEGLLRRFENSIFSAILSEENKSDANFIRTRLICTGKTHA